MTQRRASTTAAGERLVQALRSVHNTLRRDLGELQDLNTRIGLGAPAGTVQKKIRSLRTRSPLWQLRVNCLQYCHLVHAHHGHEDSQLFPQLRRSNPALGPTVKRLEADHRKVSDLLDQVQSLASLLGSDDSPDIRQRLVAALTELRTHLLRHLDFEEEAIIPTLRKMTHWPM